MEGDKGGPEGPTEVDADGDIEALAIPVAVLAAVPLVILFIMLLENSLNSCLKSLRFI